MDQTELMTINLAEWDEPTPIVAETPEGTSQRDLERGLRFTHVMMSINQLEGRDGAIFAHAVAEVLVNKGLLEKDELEAMLAKVRQEYEKLPTPKVMLGQSADKYAGENNVIINCAERLHLCKAKCCTLDFYLTEQDLDEGVAKWDFGRPYWIRRKADGYCAHNDPESLGCRIHANRPYVCRAYDCRNDKRIWEDFEQMIPAPEKQEERAI